MFPDTPSAVGHIKHVYRAGSTRRVKVEASRDGTIEWVVIPVQSSDPWTGHTPDIPLAGTNPRMKSRG